MLQAIHKETNKLVSAYKLVKDASWIGKSKEIFIAPNYEIGNWIELKNYNINEVEVSFVNHHLRYDGKVPVVDYFKINNNLAIASKINESEEHKIAKNTIYQWIFNDEIFLKNLNSKISQIAEIDNVFLEKGYGNMRADILVTFKERHKLLGKGIAFEIQLSPQNKDRTKFRSYDRAFQDYSVIWIWGDEISDNKEFYVESVYETLLYAKNEIEKENKFLLNDLSQKAELKINEIKTEIERKIQKNFDVEESQVIKILKKEEIDKRVEIIFDKYLDYKISNLIASISTEKIDEEVDKAIKKRLIEVKVEEDRIIKLVLEHQDRYILEFTENLQTKLFTCVKCYKCQKFSPVQYCIWKLIGDNKHPFCPDCDINQNFYKMPKYEEKWKQKLSV